MKIVLIRLRAVFTWLSKGIGFGFGFGFTTPFGWLVYLLWFWFYDSQVKTALQWHRSCHSKELTPLPILLAAVFLDTGNSSYNRPQDLFCPFNSRLDVRKFKRNHSVIEIYRDILGWRFYGNKYGRNWTMLMFVRYVTMENEASIFLKTCLKGQWR